MVKILSEEEKKSKEEIEEEIQKIADVKGISRRLAEKLHAKGFINLKKISISDTSALCEVEGIKEKTAIKILEAIQEIVGSKKRQTAKVLLTRFQEKMDNKEFVDSGSEELNRILGGGYLTAVSYVLWGGGASGKTEAAITAIVSAFRPYGQGGLKKEGEDLDVLFIDTEGTFAQAVSRLPKICERFGMDVDYVTEHIQVCKPTSSEQQAEMTKQELAHVQNGERDYKIVVVDSLIALFRQEFVGRGTLSDRQQKLNKHIKDLKDIIFLSDGVLIVTNQIQSNPAVMFGDPDKEAGGNIVGHNLDVHVKFKKTSEKKAYRLVSITDASWLPQADARVWITELGICDSGDIKKTDTTDDEVPDEALDD